MAETSRNLAITQGEQRIALVIGNAAYRSSPLKNPANDAQDMSAKLKALNFEVVERRNLTTKQIGSTLREFRSKLKPGAVALVFYAGHGLQIKGDNYLPAVDAEISSEEDVPNQSLAVRQIMDVLDEAKTRVNLVFLDACRNNPYARSFRSAADGLARVSAPSGTLISFATRPGAVAADGSGRNGLYTQYLLKQMDEANVPIEQVLKRVLSGVKGASAGKQEPWMEGSLEGDFFFKWKDGAQVASIAPTAVPSPPSGGRLSLDDLKQQQEARGKWEMWQAAMRADFDRVAGLKTEPDLQIAAWDRFLAAYAQKNPFSEDDASLRSEAERRKQSTEAERQRRASLPVPSFAPAPASAPVGVTAGSPIVIKLSHVVAADTPKGRAAERFAQLAAAKTRGRVRVEVYANSMLYKDKEEIEALQLGAVQMLVPSLAKFGPLGVREFEVFDLPYLFDNLDELHRVVQGPVGQDLLRRLEGKGLVGLAFWDNGFKQMSGSRALRTPDDYRGMKMRIQSSRVIEAQMRALGALPQVMAFSEVYQALQAGVVNGTENSAVNFYTQRFYEVQPYLTISDHGYMGYAVIANKRFWDGLPADVRASLEDAMREATAYANQVAKQDNDAALDAVRQSGRTNVVTLSAAERRELKRAVSRVYSEMEPRIGSDVLRAVYRATGADPARL